MTDIDYDKLREEITQGDFKRPSSAMTIANGIVLAILDEIERLRTRNARLQTVADSVEAFINCEDQACGTLYDHMEQCFYEYNEKEESE